MLNGITFWRATKDDIAYIDSSWAGSFASNSDAGKALGFDVCVKKHAPIRRALLGKFGAWCAKRSTGIILGWCVGSDDTLHYIYTVRNFRRAGIAAQLLRHSGLLTVPYYSHHTRDMRHLCKKYHMRRADMLMCAEAAQ